MKKDDLKKDLAEIIGLVKTCPEQLQVKCFELLLADLLAHREPTQRRIPEERESEPGGASQLPTEISKRMITFGGQFNVTLLEILKVFHVDDLGNVSIEVTDLKTSKTAKRQRRLALLVGGRHHFLEASYDVSIEELREMCVTYSAYDAANFLANLKNAKEIFAGFKPNATNKLSPKGKAELGSLIKELQS